MKDRANGNIFIRHGTPLYPSNNCRAHENHTLLIFMFRATVSVFKSSILIPSLLTSSFILRSARTCIPYYLRQDYVFFCPCVCRQDNSKSCQRILMKFTGAGCVTSNNLLYFGGDLIVMRTIREFKKRNFYTAVYEQCRTVLKVCSAAFTEDCTLCECFYSSTIERQH